MADISKSPIKRVIVALNIPRSNDDILRLAQKINKSMSVSTLFANSDIKLKDLSILITNFEGAQLGLATKPPTTTIASRNVAADLLIGALRGVRMDVQMLADANPAKAKDIISASGMDVKKNTAYSRKYNTTKDGPTADSIIVIGDGKGVREWRISTNEVDWTRLEPTYTSKITISNLLSGTVYFVQYHLILKNNQPSDWSSSISFKLK